MMPETQTSLTPTTTKQQDITHAGQRKINLIWEVTQAITALVMVTGSMWLAIYGVLTGKEVKTPESLTNALFLIIGFYFQRTNHQNIGGIGRKNNGDHEYSGR